MEIDRRHRREPLGCFPTPLHRHHRLGAVLGIDELWLKRDDLTGFGWSGNKVRTAEYLLGDALERGSSTVIMAAGPSSNFAATMAAAAVTVGMAVEQICYGNEPEPEVVPSALKLSRRLGVHVRFTGSDDRSSMERLAAERAAAITGAGGTPYVVPRGGATAVGSLGFASAAVELSRQLEAAAVDSPTVVMAVGSGGSIGGLVAGRNAIGASWPIIGVSVSRPIDEITPTVAAHVEACGSLIGLDDGGQAEPSFSIVDGVGDGFGRRRADEIELSDRVERECGLLLDPVYTAKAVRWLARTELSGPVLLWHTGGALGTVDALATGSPCP